MWKVILYHPADLVVIRNVIHHRASIEQIRKQFFAKLQSVYAILCCISGIKIKDLKNKVSEICINEMPPSALYVKPL